MFLAFNILLASKINISLYTDLIFTDHLFICEVNDRTFDWLYVNIWAQPSYSNLSLPLYAGQLND